MRVKELIEEAKKCVLCGEEIQEAEEDNDLCFVCGE